MLTGVRSAAWGDVEGVYPVWGSQIRTLVSKLPVAIFSPSNAIAYI